MKKILVLTCLAISIYSVGASSATLKTGPVAAAKPPGITNRGIRCVAQNFSPKPVSVSAQLVGGDGAVLFEKTISLDPEHTDYVQSIYGGSGFRYCRFAVANKNLVKAWLEVEDDSSTSIVLEAK